MAGNMNVFGGIMARGNNMAMLQQQVMQRQMMQMSTMNVATTNQQVPVATATAVPMNTTVPTVTATTVDSAPTAPPKEGMMPNSGNAQSGGGGDLTSQLNQLAQLHQSGALTDAEYKSAKNRVLGLG